MTWVLDTDWSSFRDIKEDARVELLSIILQLAKTKPEDRVDSKKNILNDIVDRDDTVEFISKRVKEGILNIIDTYEVEE